ncbi:unnamed protein product [Spirodela intermedia]|uniref:RRM domain-containing protein n=1 Tax=Spirodela intermedia TaxID=51605 RepID=A0A7I8IBD4_SPIIN|nr:unnamed protein product [Spirodela intermedia]CAA6654191.1 unnamed protein product [Spirodela intermedia]
MGRYRSRSRSFSPRRMSRSPPRRMHYDEPQDRYRGGRGSVTVALPALPACLFGTSLSTPEDLRIPFERFGPVKDVYLPKNYYTGEPRGFGFVKFRNPEDAAEAKQQMNHKVIGGREIRIVFAEENRKTPQEMRKNTRVRNPGGRRLSPTRSPRRQYRSYSYSPPQSGHDSSRNRGRGGEDDYYSPQRSPPDPPATGVQTPPPIAVRERGSRSPLRSHSSSPR